MVGHLLKVGTYHWTPQLEMYSNIVLAYQFWSANPEIGRKMAKDGLLFQALALPYTYYHTMGFIRSVRHHELAISILNQFFLK